MRKKFSNSWNSSKKPKKQRKYRANAPLHTRNKLLGTHLSPELKKKYGKRAVTVVEGDSVKILRGSFKGKETKVERVDMRSLKIYLIGVERTKKDGSKVAVPTNPSNVMITNLKLEDAKRKAAIENTRTASSAPNSALNSTTRASPKQGASSAPNVAASNKAGQ